MPVVLAGFSQGAVLALSAGLRRLPPPKGIVALSGYLPGSGSSSARGGAAYPPVLVTHGTQDSVIPVQWGREARQTLEKLGVTVQYQEFPLGHQIDRSVLGAVHKFFKETLTL